MKKKHFLVILFFIVSFTTSLPQSHSFNPKEELATQLYKWKLQNGDNPAWSQPGFDDSGWNDLICYRSFFPDTGISWARTKLIISSEKKENDNLVIRIGASLPAYDIYWDGVLLEHNGTVGHSQSEQEFGKIILLIQLNEKLVSPGEHTIAIRFSNYKEDSGFLFQTYFGYVSAITGEIGEYYVRKALLAGMYLITGLLCIALFWGGNRHKGYIIFALICLLHMINTGLHPFIEYLKISTSIQPLLSRSNIIDYYLSWILIFAFFVFNYNLPKKSLHISLFTIFVLLRLFEGLQSEFFYISRIIVLTCYPICILTFAALKKQPGSIAAILGFVLYILPNLLRLLNLPYYFLMETIPDILFIFFIILSISIQIKERNRKSDELIRLKHRLELELLKKNIQPHFLMNTLHSIKSFIDEDPPKATELIHALADEFHLIIKFLEAKFISFKDEIKLCNYHLKIMGFRRDAEFELLLFDHVDEDKIPPLIFHTLIENGITHAFKVNENGIFKLTRSQDGRTISYRLTNNGTLLKEIEKLSDSEIAEGMGIKYVKARLEEAYPGKWDFSYGVHDSKWVVNIKIEQKS